MNPHIFFETSFQLSTEEIELHNWFVYDNEIPDENCFQRVFLEIYMKPSLQSKEKKCIGFLEGTFFDVQLMQDLNCDVEEIFTLAGQKELYPYLYTKQGLLKPKYSGTTENIFVIHKLYINNDYQNKGIGTYCLNHLQKALIKLFDYEICCFIAQPYSFEVTEKGEEINDSPFMKKKVERFFVNNRFEAVDSNFLYYHTEKFKKNPFSSRF